MAAPAAVTAIELLGGSPDDPDYAWVRGQIKKTVVSLERHQRPTTFRREHGWVAPVPMRLVKTDGLRADGEKDPDAPWKHIAEAMGVPWPHDTREGHCSDSVVPRVVRES